MIKRYGWLWLSAFLLASGCPLAYARDKEPVVSVPPSIMFENLKNALLERKELQEQQRLELLTLRDEVQRLSTLLLESQRESSQLRIEVTEWETSTIESLRLSRSLRQSISDLQASLRWNRLAWQVGIPLGGVVGWWLRGLFND